MRRPGNRGVGGDDKKLGTRYCTKNERQGAFRRENNKSRRQPQPHTPHPQSNTAGPELSPYHAHKHKNPHTGSSSQAALCAQMESC